MAVGKAAAPDMCAASAACRAALDSVVAQFNEVIEATAPATIRRRLKEADIDLEALRPSAASNGFSHESPRAAAPCSPEVEA